MVNTNHIKELHYITHIENILSILENGILSYNLTKSIRHNSVASQMAQQRRENRKIPGGMRLHDYANLYFDANNKMLSKLRDRNEEIGILQIDKRVLLIENVIVSDRNASSDYVAFYPVDTGLGQLDFNKIYDRFWLHDDPMQQWIHGSIKCAEVLVPERIEPKYILGVYVYSKAVRERLKNQGIRLQITINNSMFF